VTGVSSAMPTMEKMQQRAEQHQQKWEDTEEMGCVLGD
jgi:hypothetical protein